MKGLSDRIAALSAEQRDLLVRKLGNRAEARAPEPSLQEEAPASDAAAHFDVVILGGGLAGQTLARQLKRSRPSARVLVTELRPHPVPESAHKVGESTVEIGSHYFAKVLGLEPHLVERQLRKAGLRYFLPSGANEDVGARVEMGASYFPPAPSYQLDRGRFENALREDNVTLGVEFWDRTKAVKATRWGDARHVLLDRAGEKLTVESRWVVDASGRAGVLKRQMGLAQDSGHNCNAVWFRIAGRIDIDEFSDAPHWRERIPQGLRWLSTNHFMGRGYWVWFIPLAPDATSVGIVADANLHPLDEMRSFDRTLDWMRRHEPRCAQEVARHRAGLMDFLALKHYAYACRRVFSADRWALTGEAGVFTDPFYSPGSDFIGMSNTYITDLILRDLDGEEIAARAAEYDRIYLNTYESFITVYENQYPLMGNPQVMVVKIVWDFAIYWGFLTLQFLGGRLCDLDLQSQAGQVLQRVNHLNARVQALFREWDSLECAEYEQRFVDVLAVDIMRRFHYELLDDLSGDAMLARFAANLRLVESLAAAIFHEAARLLPDPPAGAVNPYAISLDPRRWIEDGLFQAEKKVEVEAVAAATLDRIRLAPVAGPLLRMEPAHAG
jgi:flavin-dependent dehydrogenase